MKERIKELFAMLPRDEQLELLRELNSTTTIENPVKQVNEFCQNRYSQNIKFEIVNIGDVTTPLIKVDLITPWGIFTATGGNQRIAKAKVAEIALNAVEKE